MTVGSQIKRIRLPQIRGIADRDFMSDSIHKSREQQRIELLLSEAPFIKSACDLDLLVFLFRHPRTLLTNEQLATFVGYEMKQIAKSIEIFVDAGLLERTQNPIHAARMYLLMLAGPQGETLKELLAVASMRSGRSNILGLLATPRSGQPVDASSRDRKLRVIA